MSQMDGWMFTRLKWHKKPVTSFVVYKVIGMAGGTEDQSSSWIQFIPSKQDMTQS